MTDHLIKKSGFFQTKTGILLKNESRGTFVPLLFIVFKFIQRDGGLLQIGCCVLQI